MLILFTHLNNKMKRSDRMQIKVLYHASKQIHATCTIAGHGSLHFDPDPCDPSVF